LPDADEKLIRVELSGNLCRCTGYVGIVRAIQSVLAELKANPISAAPAQPSQVASTPATVAKMQTFEATALSTLATPATPLAQEIPQAAASENRKGWSRIEDNFTVDFSPEQVWAFMSDVKALASCLPGAEVTESDGKTVKGKIAIKFGPISAAFNGSAVLDRDDAKRVGTLRGAGTDSISNSRAKGDVGYQVVGIDGGRTRVEITLDHMLQGPLAQFSRSGLVRDFVSRMIADFGRNLSARMGGASVDELPASQISVSKTMLSVIWARIKRMFGG
jgi:carbon-monoxide dehydrogenase small subunit